jgi:hypothetical protein
MSRIIGRGRYAAETYPERSVGGGATGAKLLSGAGSPVGLVPGNQGDLYLDTSGGANALWANETGGVGGWVSQTVRVSRGIVPLAPDNIPDDSASHLLSAGLVHTSATANVAVWITLIGTWTGMFTPSQIGDLSFRFTVNGVPAPSAAATPYITDAAGTAVAPSQAAFVLAGFKNLVGFGPNTYSASVRLGPLSPPGGAHLPSYESRHRRSGHPVGPSAITLTKIPV